MQFIYISVVIHCMLLISIFDIYFKSSVIQGISKIDNNCPSFAKRLVLFVADGLRADKFFEVKNQRSKSPYLRNIIQYEGVWGISRTRVPTESRPGHVAMIAGLYEDPSAVFKGWKDNPVEFDSVFNQSHRTYAWGSPDIIPMFAKGSAKDRVRFETYAAQDQDFSAANGNATGLNIWVLNKFRQFLSQAETKPELDKDLHTEKLIYFFHLLGTDVAGHANKPHSKEYDENISVADNVIREIVNMINDYYSDNATAFIFTSDHGMTDWGSHGAGLADETETPIVVWGSGVNGPKAIQQSLDTPPSWELSHLERRDINQADIAPLMSILMGISIPVNSVGELPTEYIYLEEIEAVCVLYTNAKQVGTQFRWHKENIKKNALPWIKIDFSSLSDDNYERSFKDLELSISSRNVTTDLVSKAKLLIKICLAGIEYYQMFYCRFLQILVTFSFLGWICYLLCHLLVQSNTDRGEKKCSTIAKCINCCFLCSMFLALFMTYAHSFPLTYYMYTLTPIALWWRIFRLMIKVDSKLISKLKNDLYKSVFTVVAYITGIELLVLSFFYREVLSLIMMGLIIWIYFISGNIKSYPFIMWMVTAAFLIVFPFLSTVGASDNIIYVLSCGFLWILSILIAENTIFQGVINKQKFRKYQIGVILFSLSNIYIISMDFNIPLIRSATHTASWILLGFSLMMLFFNDAKKISARYFQIALNLQVPYLLLSISHEAFFTFFLSLHLLSWINLEFNQFQGRKCGKFTDLSVFSIQGERYYLSLEDFRRSYFYLYYVFLSFFGIGNIASLNSFDVNWVKNFITVFSPFTMTGLIILKTMIPFLLVTVAFRFTSLITKSRQEYIFKIVLIFCNLMSLNFFFKVSNKGSWLDIGISISHYVIMEFVTVILLMLYEVAKFISFSQQTASLPKQL